NRHKIEVRFQRICACPLHAYGVIRPAVRCDRIDCAYNRHISILFHCDKMSYVGFRRNYGVLLLGEIGERLGEGLCRRVDGMKESHLLVRNLFLEKRRKHNSSNPGGFQKPDCVETASERGWTGNERIRSVSPRYVVVRSIYYASFSG